MSHMAKTTVKIRSLKTLAQACANLGLELVLGQQHYRWFGTFMGDTQLPKGLSVADLGTCEHAIRVKNARSATYEIGVYRPDKINEPDTYGLVWDWWRGGYGLQDIIGVGENDCKKLEEEYVMCAAEEAAQALGWTAYREGTELIIEMWHEESQSMKRVTVDKSGVVEAHGFQGSGCAEVVSVITNAIGTASEITVKGDFYEQSVALNVHEEA